MTYKIDRISLVPFVNTSVLIAGNNSASVFYTTLQILLLVFLACIKPVRLYSQIPELPEWIEKVYYVDPGNSGEGDGSFQNPWKDLRVSECYNTVWPGTGWECDKCAILFKRGSSLGTKEQPLNISLRFNVDSVYIGSYGSGPKARIIFSSGSRCFVVEGEHNKISGLELINLDSTGDVLEIRGGASGVTGEGNRVDSLVISGGYRGFTFSRNRNLVIKNTLVYNTMDDGIYGGEEGELTDSVVLSGVHVHSVNKRYLTDPSNTSGGDCVQIRSAYLYVENSILDHSAHGMKFCLINTRTSGNAETIVKNTRFLMHPHDNHAMYAQNAHIDRSFFKGGGTVLNVWGSSAVYNSVFTGYGKDYIYVHGENSFYNTPVYAALLDIYNCTFIDVYTAIQATQRDVNVRNSIFYNVNNAFQLGINGINGSGNIHYNKDLTIQNGLVNYLHEDGRTKGNTSAYFSADPLFTDYENGDFRLTKESPAVDAGDPRVYHKDSIFVSGYNTGSGWAYLERKFTEYFTVKTDYYGLPRPIMRGYDIGAFEYYGVDVNDQDGNVIVIFPNPAVLWIDLLYFFEEPLTQAKITVFDIMGRMFHTENVNLEKSGIFRMEVNDYPSGVYILQVDLNPGKPVTRYFIKTNSN